MDFRLNGSIGLTVSPATATQPWEVEANLNTSLHQFQLDNQKLLSVKPLHKTFEIPKIQLDGSIIVNPSGIRPVNLVASLPHTKLRATGKIDFKTGYDLYVNGPARLEDLYQIAENDVRGKGTVNVRVHGVPPQVKVDIDADIKDGYYLGLNLGDVKGRITWDDDSDQLSFQNIQISKATTFYSLDGALDLGQTDTLNLGIQINRGNVQDVIQVFKNITTPLSWFPQTLSGPVSGAVRITGGIQFSQMQILANLNGKDWEYWASDLKKFNSKGAMIEARISSVS